MLSSESDEVGYAVSRYNRNIAQRLSPVKASYGRKNPDLSAARGLISSPLRGEDVRHRRTGDGNDLSVGPKCPTGVSDTAPLPLDPPLRKRRGGNRG